MSARLVAEINEERRRLRARFVILPMLAVGEVEPVRVLLVEKGHA